MSPPNKQEPSTKFWGPQIPLGPCRPSSTIIMQLHNLEHGEFWNPAIEAELLAPHILTPFLDFPTWRINTAVVSWTYFNFPRGHWYGGTFYIRPIQYECLNPVRTRGIFSMFPVRGVHQWGANLFTTPTGNVAYNGTMTTTYIPG